MAAVYKPRREDGSKLVSMLSFASHAGDTHDIPSLETLWPVVRLHMANETTNGEIFLSPLRRMRHILEITVLQKTGGSSSEAVLTRGAQNALYSLAVDYLPKLLSYMPRIKTNKPEMGVVLLDILCYLMAVEPGSLFSFLSTFSSSLLYLLCPEWPQAGQEIVFRLCHYVLPTFLVHRTASLPPALSTSSTLMIVLDTCTPLHHLLTLDTLMYLKKDVCTDILSLVAYGTPPVREGALKLLLHYWPLPSDFSRNIYHYGEWQTPKCENPACRHGNAQASTLCLDAKCVSSNKARTDEAKLYMLLCHDCHSVIHRAVSDADAEHFTLQIPQPLRDVKPNCEFQKMCSGKERQVNRAEVTCYDNHCTAIQGGQPIRMCRDCHCKQHSDIANPRHIYQVGPPNPWLSSDTIASSTMLEAVSKLLQSPPILHKSAQQSTVGHSAAHTLLDGLQKIHSLPYQLKVEGSQEGIWLLSYYCTPTDRVAPSQQDWLVHLTALALEWLQAYQDILKQVEEEIPSSACDDADSPSPDVTEYLQYFSNHDDISKLVDPLLTSWLCEVARTNGECLVEALQPNPRPCAQVGKLWDKNRNAILRYQRTLRSLYRLYQFFKSSHIPRDAFMKIYNSVMPEWLDLLVQLRTETGKMSVLHSHYHRLLTHPHPDGKEMIDFVWDKFRGKMPVGAEMQKALLWLQDLTRLKIPLPYIRHMFESAMEERAEEGYGRKGSRIGAKDSVASSFDEGVQERRDSEDRERKESAGSMSGNESEPALLSQSSLDESDAQAIASLNSSLTRSILMLDIWLSQMSLEAIKPAMLDYCTLKRLMVRMLQVPWGYKHSYTDHHNTTNTCLLCKATALWFSLATQLLEKNEKRQRTLEEEGGEGTGDLVSMVDGRVLRAQHQRISMKAIRSKIRKLTHGETSTSEDFNPAFSSLPMKFNTLPGRGSHKRELEDSRNTVSVGCDGAKAPVELEAEFECDFPPAEVKPKPKRPLRKMATYQSEALPALQEEAGEEGEGEEEEDEDDERGREEEEEEDGEDIHKVFQLCRDHLKPKLHPEAIHKIVQCLMVLLRRSRVLHDMSERQGWSEARFLFKDLWRCIDAQSSFVACSCVGLLLDCLKFLNDQELPQGVEKTTCWTTFHQGLKTDKFKTVEKLSIFLRFMKSPETELDWSDGTPTVTAIQVTVGYAFCLAVQLLQDKTSSVTSRAQYCLSNLSNTTVKALRQFVMRLFLDLPAHRTLTLHSLSLLNSALPELSFLSVELLERIISCLTPHSASLTGTTLSGDPLTSNKKESVPSEGSGPSPKTSISSFLPSSPMVPSTPTGEEGELLQLALSLLLKYIANPTSNAEESMKRARQRGLRETSLEPEVRPPVLSRLRELHSEPPSLRASPVFHVFLNHIYPALDHNQEFSTPNALIFVLNRLVYCTAPTGEEEFLQCLQQSGGKEGKRCEFGLGVLPPALRVPWLHVFYVILYKYIHKYQSSEVELDQELVYLARCCMEIALNTVEVSPHVCPLLAPSGYSAPPLRRQRTVESYPSGTTSSSHITSGLSLEHHTQQERDAHSLSPVPEEATSQQSTPIRLSSVHKVLHSTMSAGSIDSIGSATSVFLRPRSVPTLHSGLCSVCCRVTNEFSEDVIALCAIVVTTCCHRLPTRVSGYLVSRVIPALAKVITAGSYSWQRSSEEPPPGSASAVSSNLLKSVATQFADRRLFLFLFNYEYEKMAEDVFTALGAAFPAPPLQGEGEDGEMTVASPVTYFLQDAVNSQNFPQDVRRLSLIYLALYVEKTPLSLATMFKHMNLLDSFCKKLRTTTLLHDTKAVYGFMRFIIQLLVSAPSNLPHSTLRSPPVHAFSQSLVACLEVVFHHVCCPVVGLFQLAGNWYQTFLASPRDAGRLVQLYISELRRALKSYQSTEVMHFGTLVSLTQVLLLEENGYLSYVDGLTEEKVYAPQLRDQFEYGDLFLTAIQEMQWDFVDAMLFLDSSTQRLSPQQVQELPRLKLLMGQLLALRVQHGRSPVEQLRRFISGDLRPISLPSSKTTHQRAAVRWHDHLSALHIFSWMLLGAMSHNAVHQVVSTDNLMGGGGGRCQLLGSLDTNMEVVTASSVWLTRGAMQGMKGAGVSETTSTYCQYLLFTFAAAWTGYMELYEQDCTAAIVQFWENFVSNMVDVMGDFSSTDEKHRIEVLHNVNDKVIIPLKKLGLSCYALLLPIWRKLSQQLTADRFREFPDIPVNTTTVAMDTWLKDMVAELVTVEHESGSGPHLATTAV